LDFKIESWQFIICYSFEAFMVSAILWYSLGNNLGNNGLWSQKACWISLVTWPADSFMALW